MQKILVIDNDTAILDVMHDALSYEGFEVKTVLETNNVSQLLNETKPDLVIIDYLLNGINGSELCSYIKKNPATASLPVILFSASPKAQASLNNCGCNAFIAKPFDLAILIGKINSLI